MKKILVGLFLTILFFISTGLFGQDPPPGDGSGQYLDQADVPIRGEIFFMIAALGVGGFILVRNRKKQTIRNTKE